MKVLGTIRKIVNTKANSSSNTNYILYPQFEIQSGNTLRRISKDEFPKRGTIFITGFQDPMGLAGNSIVLVDAELQVMPMYESMKETENAFKYSIYGGSNNIKKVAPSQLVQIIELDGIRNIKDIIENEHARYIDGLSTAPLNSKVLIAIDEYIYGPFTYIPAEQTEDSVKIKLSIKEGMNKHGEYSIFKYLKEDIEKICHVYNRFVSSNLETPEKQGNYDIIPQKFILDIKELEDISVLEELDFIDDKTLLNLIQTTLSSEKLYEMTKSTLKDIKELAATSKNLSFAEERAARLALILSNNEQVSEFRKLLLKTFFATPEGEEYAKFFIMHNEEMKQQAKFEYDAEYNQEKQSQVIELQELRSQIEQAKNEREKQKKELEAEQLKDIDGILASKNTNIQELDVQIAQKTADLDTLLDVMKLVKDIESLKQEEKMAQISRDKLMFDKRNTEADFQKKVAELNGAYNNFEKQLIDSALAKKDDIIISSVIDMLKSQNTTMTCKDSCELEFDYVDISFKVIDDITIDDILERFEKVFESVNRAKSKEEILNYLICITQRVTTVFAGAPGTGKTSLVTLIAKALGLYDERFTSVSVERNWTSYKDWVGYHNPLTGKVEKAATGVFDTFAKLTYEQKKEISIPQFVLLDEANLSPIEHYWSKFLLTCDPMDKNKNIFEISDKCSFKLPESLKFLATINFDHTTEILSERFLDRVWVILIQNFEPSFDEYEESTVSNLETIIGYDKLVELFSIKSETLDEHLTIALKAIIQVYTDNKKNLSPRSFEAVKKYCAVAQKYTDYMAGKYKPLDYAVAQKILPLINGYGEGYKKLLDDLLAVFNRFDMNISIGILEDILDRGKDQHGYYQFFGSR